MYHLYTCIPWLGRLIGSVLALPGVCALSALTPLAVSFFYRPVLARLQRNIMYVLYNLTHQVMKKFARMHN